MLSHIRKKKDSPLAKNNSTGIHEAECEEMVPNPAKKLKT